MHFLLSDADCEPFLLEELRGAIRSGHHEVCAAGLVSTDLELEPEAPPTLVFARQLLLNPSEVTGTSIREWSERLLLVSQALPDTQPWQLHIAPHYASGNA